MIAPCAALLWNCARQASASVAWLNRIRPLERFDRAMRCVALELRAARLGIAEGQELYELVASEFGAAVSPDPSYAVGHVTLSRPKSAAGSSLPAGLIREGTRFRKRPDAAASPPIKGAVYESTAPVFVPTYSGTVDQVIEVPIRAASAGTDGNVQSWETGAFVLADTLFDRNLRVDSGEAAGGSVQYSTAKLRTLAFALSTGQYGPVSAALVAGALSTPGVSRCVSRGGTRETIWIADDSWCSSREFMDNAKKTVQENWLGFGCRYEGAAICNVRASIEAGITLRDRRHIASSMDIAEAVRREVKSFFDDRPDFHIWRESTIRAVITRADRRILSCGSVIVKDVDGKPISEPNIADVIHYDVDTTNASLEFDWP